MLQGIAPPAGGRGRWMPAFGDALTDAQVTALVAYLRRAAAGAPPWPDLEAKVRDARKDGAG